MKNNTNEISDSISLELRDVLNQARTNLSEKDMANKMKKMQSKRTYQKRTANEIRDSIIEYIKIVPRSTHSIAKHLGTHPTVVNRHLNFLHLHNSVVRTDEVLQKTTKDGRMYIQRNKYWSVVK